MKRACMVLALAACGDRVPDAHYVEPVGPPHWCRLSAGAYAFQWRPTTSPALIAAACDPGKRPDETRSTLAELVVAPGTAIDIAVTVPEGLGDCVVDSLVLTHGVRDGDLEIGLTSDASTVPVVAYDKVPIAREPLVRDFPIAVARARASPSLVTEVTLAADAIHGSIVKLSASLATGTEVEPVAAPRELWLVAVRHIVGLPAPARTFALTLRAREAPFSFGVRSTAESSDPPLRFRASNGAPPVPTNLVPMAAVVLTSCKLRAGQALDLIEREYRTRPPPQIQ